MSGKKGTKDFLVLPFNAARVGKRYLVTNRMGCWDFLSPEEFRRLNSLQAGPKDPFFERVRNNGLVADAGNIGGLLEDFRRLNSHLFNDTALHIAVLTRRCNLRCRYCQTEGGKTSEDMSVKVAGRVLKYLFDVRSPSVVLEFQGGEPLLNWPILTLLTEDARRFNTLGKDLRITLVTNLLLLDKAKAKFLIGHKVDVCVSYDGPADIHDVNRVDIKGRGTHKALLEKIALFRSLGGRVNLLPTVTKAALVRPEAFVDEMVALGVTEIALRAVNGMGYACGNWSGVGYTPEEFCGFYRRALDHMIALNRRGVAVRERTARVILTKVLARKDPGFVDMMTPCGAGRATMVYMPDGSCYPCDEARMLDEEMFRLGNIVKEDLADMLNKENLLHLLQASSTDLWHYRSVFSPWIGYCPAVNYAMEKNIVPKAACSPMQKVQEFQFMEIFRRLEEGGDTVGIFNRWTGIEGKGHARKKEKDR